MTSIPACKDALLLSLACLMLAACSLRPDQPQPTTYTLAPERQPEQALTDKPDTMGTKIAIAPVEAAPDLKSRRILIKRPGGITDYYADSRWNLAPAKLVSDVIKEALTARFGSRIVPHRQAGYAPDYKLQLRLRDFQAEYTESTDIPPVVRVAVTADLHTTEADDEVSRKRFDVTQKADANTMRDVRVAFEKALHRVTDKIAATLIREHI